MTPEEFKAKMDAVFTDGDPERAHMAADALMVELLQKLGYGEGAQAFEEAEKWYA